MECNDVGPIGVAKPWMNCELYYQSLPENVLKQPSYWSSILDDTFQRVHCVHKKITLACFSLSLSNRLGYLLKLLAAYSRQKKLVTCYWNLL